MEEKLTKELIEELKDIKEEMKKQTETFSDIAEAIVEELRGIKNEVSR